MSLENADMYEIREALMANKREVVLNMPKVSVIVKTHNDEYTILNCLIALSKQSLEEIEIIVIDENSEDSTYSLACTYSEIDNRVKVFKAAKDLEVSKLAACENVVTILPNRKISKNFAKKVLKKANNECLLSKLSNLIQKNKRKTSTKNITPNILQNTLPKNLLTENQNISVVIPTLQKNKKLLVNLLSILDKDESVSEIILIDNSLQGLDYNSSKLRIIIPEGNLYVNPSWNLGVREAKNDIVALLNDDITIAPNFCSNVAKNISPQIGCVGVCLHDIEETDNEKLFIEDSPMSFQPINLITYHWGIAIFFNKASYVEIPNDMKVFRGDDWLFYKNKEAGRQNYYIKGQKVYHYGSLSSRSTALKSIGRTDRKNYRRYIGKKWYNFFFDIDELSDGYRLTLFGFKIFLPDETSPYRRIM